MKLKRIELRNGCQLPGIGHRKAVTAEEATLEVEGSWVKVSMNGQVVIIPNNLLLPAAVEVEPISAPAGQPQQHTRR
jgi:hypothetical protein